MAKRSRNGIPASVAIRKHVNRLLGNFTWVADCPDEIMTACAVYYTVADGLGREQFTWFGDGTRVNPEQYIRVALDELYPDRPEGHEDVVAWNDSADRQLSEVIAVLERAEKLALIDEEEHDEQEGI